MRNPLLLTLLLSLFISCGQEDSPQTQVKLAQGQLLNDTIWNGDNWTPKRRRFQLDTMFHGRVVSVSKAFEECVTKSVENGTRGNGPYYYCKGDPHKSLSKAEQAKKALHVTRKFYNVEVKYEPNGSGNAHHHGGGSYDDQDQYFHWAGWFNSAADSFDYKICSDAKFCQENPGHRKCSRFERSDNEPGNRRCRWSAYPWPYSQAAGIAWHEVMHHHDYGHGANNQNDAPEKCETENISNWHFQRNTMPYIVGRCVSRILSRSQDRCGSIKAGSKGLKLIKDYNSRDCEVVEDPKRKGVQFVAQHSNKCIVVYWNSLEDEANINQWSCNSSGAQHFTLRPHSSGYYEIENRTSGKCLDVAKSSQKNGANIIQYECNRTTNQMWKLRDMGRGYYMLEAMHSGKCLDVRRSGRDNKTNIIQWDCNNTTNQRFKIRGLYHSKDFGSDIGERFFQISESSFNGITGRSGALVDSFGMLVNGSASETFGGNGGRAFRYECPRGTSVVGVHGRSGARIDSIGVTCANSNHSRKYKSPTYGGNGGRAFNFTCQKGFKVKKVQGLSSNRLVNRLNVSCGQ